jgi:hypothetical protein
MPGFLGGSSSGGTSGEIRFPAEFIDPVTKLRVSEPQTLMDTDFEYGLQPTKWETVELINNTPSFFSASGDTTIPNIAEMTTTAGSREIKIVTSLPHSVAVGIPINVTGTKSLTADGSYIINSIPDATTFTYLCKQNQLVTASILDLYTSIITGQFFQGSQIRISDSLGIVTNATSPQSTLTITTDAPHGFGVNTPFYFLNLNSTISQTFDSSNTGSKTFDASNTATAQSFDGSNTLTSYLFDLNNRPVSGGVTSAIVNVAVSEDTITVTHAGESFVGKPIGTPLYYSVAATGSSGHFVVNPRGVVYLASNSNLGTNSSTFSVSLLPGGAVLDLTTAFTGTFQLANTATTFAGNTVDEQNQTVVNVDAGTPRSFDGANNTGSLSTVNSFSNGSTFIQMVNDAGSGTDTGLYVGAMLQYTTTGTAAGGLTNNTTYWITYYNVVVSAAPGLIQIKVAATVGGADITIASQGSGTHKFRQTGVSADKDIVHLRTHGLVSGDMVKYTYPAGGAITRAAFVKDYMFVTRIDNDNFQLESDIGMQATGGTVTTPNIGGLNYKLHEFKVAASPFIDSQVFTFTVSSGQAVADFLVVGGGGAGGQYVGGGGGAGRMAEGTMNLSPGTYTITVGGGGRKTANGLVGGRDGDWRDGNLSSLVGGGVTISCPGGGRGGNYPDNGQGSANAGGSGGGSGGFQGGGGQGGGAVGATLTGVLTGASYGNGGGSNSGSRPNNDTEGRGGGGAGAAGTGGYGAEPGDGGVGRANSITGTSFFWAGGGGGGGYYTADYGSNRAGNGGAGGGGGGGSHANGIAGVGNAGGIANGDTGSTAGEGPGGNAAPHTGGGGGGCGHSQHGGNGGSGVVYIRYRA